MREVESQDIRIGMGVASETGGQNRAIRFSLEAGYKNPKIIASTGLKGYGAIVFYTDEEDKSKLVASVGAKSLQDAANAALRECRLRGARFGRVVQVWNDI